MFYRLSKHFEFRQKYSTARRIFNSVFGYLDETLSQEFDILHQMGQSSVLESPPCMVKLLKHY